MQSLATKRVKSKTPALRLPHGARGKVVDVQVFDRQQDRDLPAGVETMVRVSVAQRRRLTTGDKMAGRHGNKGCYLSGRPG